MRFHIDETGRDVVANERPVVIITSNNEKELPDAFLRRCVFHYIEFPSKELMGRIVRVHHPDVEDQVLDQAIEVFYGLRATPRLRKRPSTSELIDWICALQEGRASTSAGSAAASRSSAPCSRPSRTSRPWASGPRRRATRGGVVLIDFLFELRRRKLKVSSHEWLALMEALALGLHDSSLDGFYHLARSLCVKDVAEFDAFDEAFLAYFKDVGQRRAGPDRRAAGVAGRSQEAGGADRRAAQAARGPRPRPAARPVRAAPEGAEGAPRRRQPLDRDRGHVAVRLGRRQPARHPGRLGRRPLGDAGRRRAALPRVPQGRRPRRPPDRHGAARPAQAGPRGRRGRARPRRDRRRDLPQRRRARDRVPAAAAQPGQGAAADGRRRLDGPARRAGLAPVHRGVADRAVLPVPQLLLPQLHLPARLRGRAVQEAGPGRRAPVALRPR